jgi:hypothetical protein
MPRTTRRLDLPSLDSVVFHLFSEHKKNIVLLQGEMSIGGARTRGRALPNPNPPSLVIVNAPSSPNGLGGF